MHAHDSTCGNFDNANDFLNAFIASAAVIRVDPGFAWDEGTNRSLIGQEYLTHLPFGMAGSSFLQTLASSQRAVEAEKRVSDSFGRKSNQMIRNKRDRTFLRVAVNTLDRILVSHDFADFQVAKRAEIRKIFAVQIIEASDGTKMINE